MNSASWFPCIPLKGRWFSKVVHPRSASKFSFLKVLDPKCAPQLMFLQVLIPAPRGIEPALWRGVLKEVELEFKSLDTPQSVFSQLVLDIFNLPSCSVKLSHEITLNIVPWPTSHSKARYFIVTSTPRKVALAIWDSGFSSNLVQMPMKVSLSKSSLRTAKNQATCSPESTGHIQRHGHTLQENLHPKKTSLVWSFEIGNAILQREWTPLKRPEKWWTSICSPCPGAPQCARYSEFWSPASSSD